MQRAWGRAWGRAWDRAWGWLRGRDWPLVIIVAAFILLVPLFAVWVPPLSRLAKWLDASTISIYERAIMNAAVKTTAYEKAQSLETIDPNAAEIQVVTFKAARPTNPLDDDAWVSLPGELRSKCAGKPDPAQALREILGLPPGSSSQSVYRMTVIRDDKTGKLPIFRPCISSPDIRTKNCSLEFPELPAGPELSTDLSDEQRAQAYGQLWAIAFLARHMWTSYRVGFPRTGYPFTGLGWSYNWDPTTDLRIGISEFVVRKGATVKVEGPIAAEAFCGG
jgi:hypothetical protein